MRMLTDAEAGFVAGGHDTAAATRTATEFCARNPGSTMEYEHGGREVRATVAGSGITVGGGTTKVVVKCGGRTEKTDDDKKES